MAEEFARSRSVDRRPANVERTPSGGAFREGTNRESRWRPGHPFLFNAWYLAGYRSEFDTGLTARTILDQPILFFRDRQGGVAALEDRCPHVGAPLSMGTLTDGAVRCGYHGMVFDAGGQCIEIPGQAKIPAQACVHNYPVRQRAEHVWIWMGDPAQASEHPLPDFAEDDEFFAWPRYQGLLEMECNYSLMLQNLMDLTHLAYVHADSIGGNPADHATDRVTPRKTENGVGFLRELREVDAPGRYIERFGSDEKLDRWSDFEFIAPAVIRQQSGWGPVGTGVIEKRTGVLRDKMLHAITPATASRSYYFFHAADWADPDHDRARARLAGLCKIIREDIAVAEAQQLRLEGVDPRDLVAIRSDRPRLMMIEDLDRKIRLEQASRAG